MKIFLIILLSIVGLTASAQNLYAPKRNAVMLASNINPDSTYVIVIKGNKLLNWINMFRVGSEKSPSGGTPEETEADVVEFLKYAYLKSKRAQIK